MQTLSADFTDMMSIDLGFNNICAVTFKYSNLQYLINGKSLKSKNFHYNKEVSRPTDIQMKYRGNMYLKRTEKINTVNMKRDHYMYDHLIRLVEELFMM